MLPWVLSRDSALGVDAQQDAQERCSGEMLRRDAQEGCAGESQAQWEEEGAGWMLGDEPAAVMHGVCNVRADGSPWATNRSAARANYGRWRAGSQAVRKPFAKPFAKQAHSQADQSGTTRRRSRRRLCKRRIERRVSNALLNLSARRQKNRHPKTMQRQKNIDCSVFFL